MPTAGVQPGEANQVPRMLLREVREWLFTGHRRRRSARQPSSARIVLEDLDFLVDCNKQRLVPRDPDFVVSEIE